MRIARILLSLSLSLLVACSGEEPAVAPAAEAASPASPASPVTTDGPRASDAAAASGASEATPGAAASLAIVEGYLAAWNAHDADRAGSFLGEDSRYFDAAFAGLQQGREATVEKVIGVFLRGMPDLRWEMRSEPIATADGIAYEWTLTGTHTGTWGGIPATGQKVNLKGMSFVRIADGGISYQAVVYDSATLNRQLGL